MPDYGRLNGRFIGRFATLLGVTRNDAWEEWLIYILKGVEETATWTTAKIAAVR